MDAEWAATWAEKMAGKNCPLCASMGQGDNDHTVAVADLPYSEVRLERRSRLKGYCIVVWKGLHVAEPTDLDAADAAGYWQDVLATGRAIKTLFAPIKLNLLTLGNWVPHLHTHVVPRYHDDPAPGGPIAWDAMFTDEPIPAGELHRQAAALRAKLLS